MGTLTNIVVGTGVAIGGLYAGYKYETTYPDPHPIIEGVIEMTDTLICGKEVVLPQYYVPYSAFYNKDEIGELTQYFNRMIPKENQKAVVTEFFSVMRTEDQRAVITDLEKMNE